MPADDLLAVADGPIRVELLPAVGARLHRLQAFGHDLLRTPDDLAEHTRDPFRWGAYVMAPWCNRIAAVPTDVDGNTVSVPSNFPDGTAIHGQVYDAPWDVASDDALSIGGGGSGWPWPYRCGLKVTIANTVLTIDQSLTNLADSPMPAGLGLHPWFRRPLDLAIQAEAVLPSNLDPDTSVQAVAGPWDLRGMHRVPDDVDATWLAPRDPAVELSWPDIGVGVHDAGPIWRRRLHRGRQPDRTRCGRDRAADACPARTSPFPARRAGRDAPGPAGRPRCG